MTRISLLLILIFISGCATGKSGSHQYLIPQRDEVYHTVIEGPESSVYEKEKNGIHVATMAAIGRDDLLVLSVAVRNQSNKYITVSPDKIFLTMGPGFLILPLTPQKAVDKKLQGGTTSFFSLLNSIPYSDPYGVSSSVSAASSMMNTQKQGRSEGLTDILEQRYFKQVNLPPGLATQGLIYYDPVGYRIRKTKLPVNVIVQIGTNRFDFHFLSAGKKSSKKKKD